MRHSYSAACVRLHGNPVSVGKLIFVIHGLGFAGEGRERPLTPGFALADVPGLATVFCHESADCIPWRTHEQRIGKTGNLPPLSSLLECYPHGAPVKNGAVVEQHGPHSAMLTDVIIPNEIACRLKDKREDLGGSFVYKQATRNRVGKRLGSVACYKQGTPSGVFRGLLTGK